MNISASTIILTIKLPCISRALLFSLLKYFVSLIAISKKTSEMEINKKEEKLKKKALKEAREKQFDDTDENRIDNRDENDSTKDWDAEENKSGRHK